MQTNLESNEQSVAELSRAWAELKAEVEEKIRMAKTRRANDEEFALSEEEMMEFAELLGRLSGYELRLERAEYGGVLEGIDPRVRSDIVKFARQYKKRVSDLLEDGEFEIDDDDEFKNDAWNFVYFDLGGPQDMLLRYRQISTIVTSTTIPTRTKELLEEAKTSYAVGQTHAVFALGRMILEAAVTDIGVRSRRFPEPESLEDFYGEYPPGKRANELLGTKGYRRKEFRQLYDAGSKAIHPSSQSIGIEPLEYLDRVVIFMSNEYAILHKG